MDSPRTERVVLALALAILAPAAATETFRERISVMEIEVPVQVLHNGRPVRGLSAEDFELYDGGERREIRSFEVIDLSVEEATEGTAPSAAPKGRHRNFLLFFDLDYGGLFHLERARLGALELVTFGLHPSDRVAVGYYAANSGVRMLSGFSTNRKQNALALEFLGALLDGDKKAVADTGAALAASLGLDGEERNQLQDLWPRLGPTATLALSVVPPSGLLGEAPPVTGRRGLVTGRRGLAAETPRTLGPGISSLIAGDPADLLAAARESVGEARAEAQLNALGELATLLRDVRGQNFLVFFSPGFARGPIVSHRLAKAMERMFQSFRKNGWTVHAVDVVGIPAARSADISEAGVPSINLVSQTGFTAEALLALAKGTGGEIYENINDMAEAGARVLRRTSITYLLTFDVADPVADGRYNKIEVKVRGLPLRARIRHRPGYFAPPPIEKRSELERRLDFAELLLGKEERQELAAAVVAVPYRGRAVPVVIEVPGSAILAGGAGKERRVQIHAYAFDEEGRVVDVLAQDLVFDSQRVGANLTARGLRFLGDLELTPGEHRLRTLVHVPGNNRTYLSTLPLSVGGDGPRLLPPLFPDRSGGWVLVREADLAEGADSTQYPFQLGGRGFQPAVAPVIPSGGAFPLCIQGYGLSGEGAVVETRIADAVGERAPGGGVTVLGREPPRDDGLETMVGRLHTVGLPPGDYRVEISLHDRHGTTLSTAIAGFSVSSGSED